MSEFKVGQRLRCVNAVGAEDVLTEGAEYTAARVTTTGDVAVTLGGCGWMANRFVLADAPKSPAEDNTLRVSYRGVSVDVDITKSLARPIAHAVLDAIFKAAEKRV